MRLSLVGIIIIVAALIGCQANGTDNSEPPVRVENHEDKTIAEEKPNLFITPLTLGRELSQVSPYIMFNYGLHKSKGPIYLFTTSYEQMEYEEDNLENLIVGILFINQGDLHEPPLGFYIYGERHPDFITSVNFCIHEDEIVDEKEWTVSIFARTSCVFDAQAKAGSLHVTYKPDEAVFVNQEKYKYNFHKGGFSYSPE